MAKFVTIGERLSTTAPAVNKAFTERDAEPILKRAKQQLDAVLHIWMLISDQQKTMDRNL